MNTDEPLPTRASLLERMKDPRDGVSWEEFHRTYRGLLIGVARRAGLNEQEADEAVQETLVAVAKNIPDFRYEPGKDSFKGWLLQIVRWKVVDQVRRRSRDARRNAADDPDSIAERLGRAEHSDSSSDLADPRHDFTVLWEREWERHLLTQALARVKRQARPEHYAIYHLHVVEECSVEEVRHTLGVSSAAIYLAKNRVGALVKKEVRRLRAMEL